MKYEKIYDHGQAAVVAHEQNHRVIYTKSDETLQQYKFRIKLAIDLNTRVTWGSSQYKDVLPV